MVTPPHKGPLDNRGPELLATNISLTILATAFALLRLVVTWRNRRKFMLSDYLLMVAIVFNAVANGLSATHVNYGQGRHVYDPSVTPAMLLKYQKHLFWTQILNIWAMGWVKASICAYLMALNFSAIYRAIVWLSVVVVVALNFISPTVSKFGYCRPISKVWLPKTPGSCWNVSTRVTLSYWNVGANIATDVVYTAAPLVYLAQVQLPKKTKIGVSAVFLFGAICSVISILKLLELHSLGKASDPTYDSVDLSLFSIAEVAIGMFTASLPPLRKVFETLFSRILPSTLITSGSRLNIRNRSRSRAGQRNTGAGGGFQLHTIGSAKPNLEKLGDEGSERSILREGRLEAGEVAKKEGIYRSTEITQTVLERLEKEDSRMGGQRGGEHYGGKAGE